MKRYAIIGVIVLLTACDTPDIATPVVEQSIPVTTEVFTDLTAQAGLHFNHDIGASGQFFFPEIMGSGTALIDFDGDGDLDVYLVQSAAFPGEQAEQGNQLYKNELMPTGVLRFSDVTDTALVGHTGYGMGAAVADIDNDGDQDLYVTNFGSNVLYSNNGDGTFRDVTAIEEMLDDNWSTSAAFFDYDRDGDMDLYVSNYVAFSLTNNVACTSHAGQHDYCNPTAYTPQRDRLWQNDGTGRFVDVSALSGVAEGFGNGLGVTSADFNNDGWPDLYVANDMTANYLWINQQDGSFEERALISGSAYNANGAPEASMGVTAGDYDGDGDDDLFMTHLGAQTNTIYRNNGTGAFIDVSDMTGLSVASLGFTGFGTAWFDVNNDGLLDLFSANGAVQVETAQAAQEPYPYLQRNQLFVNRGEGQFTDTSAWSGAAMQVALVSRGAAFGDIDNDGDTDIVVTNNNGPAQLLVNNLIPTPWLRVKLTGTTSNRDGIGARVAVLNGDTPLYWRRAHTDGSYLSAGDGRVHFGLADATGVNGVRVKWPSGLEERWDIDQIDRQIELVEGSGRELELNQ